MRFAVAGKSNVVLQVPVRFVYFNHPTVFEIVLERIPYLINS